MLPFLPFDLAKYKVQLIIALVVLAIIGALAWTAKHYHEAYIKQREETSSVRTQLISALSTAQACSDNTEKLRKDAEAREAKVKEDLKKAEEKAKAHKSFATEILTKEVPVNTDLCVGGNTIINEYLIDMRERENVKD